MLEITNQVFYVEIIATFGITAAMSIVTDRATVAALGKEAKDARKQFTDRLVATGRSKERAERIFDSYRDALLAANTASNR